MVTHHDSDEPSHLDKNGKEAFGSGAATIVEIVIDKVWGRRLNPCLTLRITEFAGCAN